MAVETVPIDSISPDPANARKHGARNLETVIASFRRFGQQIPLVVDKSNVVRVGNARLEAAKQLGWDTIQIVRTELTSSEAIAYAIADNRTAELAEWDDDVLAAQLNGLLAEDEELLTSAGFTDEELEELLGDIDGVDPAEITEDEVPEPLADPITKAGDLWMLGDHRLLCGDSTKAQDVERLMDGAKAGMMVTDPPYGVEYDADWRNQAKRPDGTAYGASALGKVSNDDRADWRESWALFHGDIAYVWHAGCRSPEVAESLTVCDFVIRNLIVWAKNSMVIGRGDYHHQHEPCWYVVRKGCPGRRTDDRTQTTLWQIDKPHKSETGHSTQKPVECMARPMRNHEAELVYDPFLGSGTTLIAAEQLGRKCYGMEISPQYCDVIVKRWETLTGQKATLQAADRPASTGATP
jgi:DNA modification methylase